MWRLLQFRRFCRRGLGGSSARILDAHGLLGLLATLRRFFHKSETVGSDVLIDPLDVHLLLHISRAAENQVIALPVAAQQRWSRRHAVYPVSLVGFLRFVPVLVGVAA